MKYTGDTPAKKVARLVVWKRIKELLGARFYTEHHLVLLSSEAGDVSTLLGLGVHPSHIIGVDKNKHAVAASKYKYEYVPCEHGDVIAVAKKYHKEGYRIVSCFLDFCGPMHDATVGKTAEITQYMDRNAALAIAVKMGREMGHWADTVNKAQAANSTGNAAFYLRVDVLTKELLKRGKKLKQSAVPTDFYRCSSERATGEMSEMLIAVGKLSARPPTAHSICNKAYYANISATERDIGPIASMLAQQGEEAHLLLNIKEDSIPAYKAHRTRGTYEGRSTRIKNPTRRS